MSGLYDATAEDDEAGPAKHRFDVLGLDAVLPVLPAIASVPLEFLWLAPYRAPLRRLRPAVHGMIVGMDLIQLDDVRWNLARFLAEHLHNHDGSGSTG